MVKRERLTPSLFDKLVADLDLVDADAQGTATVEVTRAQLRYFSVPTLERFGEAALRSTVRRDLAWLLNTVCLGSSVDLGDHPQVARSVLNFGVSGFAGRSATDGTVAQQARDIRDAIRIFEPRIDPATLKIRDGRKEPGAEANKVRGSKGSQGVNFIIEGEIVGPADLLPVRFKTDIDPDSGVVEIRE